MISVAANTNVDCIYRNSIDYAYPVEKFEFHFDSYYHYVKGIAFTELGKKRQVPGLSSKKCYYDYFIIRPDPTVIIDYQFIPTQISGDIVVKINPQLLAKKVVIYPAESILVFDYPVNYYAVKFSLILYDDFKNLPFFVDIDVDKLLVTNDNAVYWVKADYKVINWLTHEYDNYLFRHIYSKEEQENKLDTLSYDDY
jgi:hypothetical protein